MVRTTAIETLPVQIEKEDIIALVCQDILEMESSVQVKCMPYRLRDQ